ncbi:hypothetical protein EKO23_20050 [Nocardioides guangzhouensis]|uniref:Peptidase M11 gametolysin domain-containing protein n=1 Tax=Nocardioides guangzhouensis TaxID=2497878 RepID=A0A4Q4Z5U1_9ACTN|nr:hypothetical protein [Nocardioides guangzhouensis]RYP83137.1 hypothetical protein EKO23_20050 [Nocardioides guangzhouensis]
MTRRRLRAAALAALAVTATGLAATAAPAVSSPTAAPGTRVHVSGDLVTAYADDFDDHTARTLYWVETDAGRVAVRPAPGDELPTSGHFEGTVAVPAGRTLAGAAADAPLTVVSADVSPAAAASMPPTAHRLYVAVVTNRGTAMTSAEADAEVSEMAQDWISDAPGAVSGMARDPGYAIKRYASTATPSVASGCGLLTPGTSYFPMFDEASRLFPGVPLDTDMTRHLVVLLPPACNTQGTVGLGGGGLVLAVGDGDAGPTLTHELGHELGLGHANTTSCSFGTGPDCEYLDLHSPMGMGIGGKGSPALSTAHKAVRGWTRAGEMETVDTTAAGTQTFTLQPRGSSAGLRGLAVPDPRSDDTYYVDFRDGGGLDADAAYPLLTGDPFDLGLTFGAGVTVTTLPGAGNQTTLQVDGGSVPASGGYQEGDTFSGVGVKVHVTSVTGNAAQVEVEVTDPGQAFTSAPAPVVTGTPRVGQTLTAATGGWSPAPTTTTVTWYVDGQVVLTADGRYESTTYPLDYWDAGKTVTAVVTARLADHTVTRRESLPVGPIAHEDGMLPVPGAPSPVLTGTAKVGNVVTAQLGTWPVGTTFAFDWYLVEGDTYIRSTTTGSLRLPASTYRKQVYVAVRGTWNDRYTDVWSGNSAPVGAGTLTTSVPRISGTVKVGRTLTAKPGSWTTATRFAYRWFANGTAVKGATARTFTPSRAQAGKRLTVRVTGSKAGYKTAARTSKATPRVAR